MGRGRESRILEQLAETVRRVFGRISTNAVDVLLSCGAPEAAGTDLRAVSSAIEHRVSAPLVLAVRPPAVTTSDRAVSIAGCSFKAAELEPSSATVVDARLERLTSPRVASVGTCPAVARTTEHPMSVPTAAVRQRPISPAAAMGRQAEVPRIWAKSVRVVSSLASASSVDSIARASALPLRRQRMAVLTAEVRAAAHRAVQRRAGLDPAAVELIGVFGLVPTAQPERLAVVAGGNVLLLWYPVGVRTGDAASLAVVRSRSDARLYATFLPSDNETEGGSLRR